MQKNNLSDLKTKQLSYAQMRRSQTSFCRSTFTHLIPKSHLFCLLHSLTFDRIYGDRLLKQLYLAFCEPSSLSAIVDKFSSDWDEKTLCSVINELIQKGLIVTDNENDEKRFARLLKQGLEQKQIQHMYIIVTDSCNLSCKYCYIEEGRDKQKLGLMSTETARKSIDLFSKLTEKSKKISITFYGGEPLLNPSTVYSAMRYIRALEQKGSFKKPVVISLITNGILVNDETIKVLLETKSRVCVSIDGPAELHNGARVDTNGKGTFNRALYGYNMLKKAGVNPSISCTLNRYNVHHISELTKFIAKELKPSSMSFNLLYPQMDGINKCQVSPTVATKKLIFACKSLKRYGIYEGRMMRHIKPFAEHAFYFKDCLGVGGQIVVTPDGRIGPCQAVLGVNRYFPFSIDDSPKTSDCLYENNLFSEWVQRFPLNMKDCHNCFAIAVCGGGCPYASLATYGTIWRKNKQACTQSKGVMKWMIWETYNNISNKKSIEPRKKIKEIKAHLTVSFR
jgi:uncharacterized protein